jgi:hypothetical protein
MRICRRQGRAPQARRGTLAIPHVVGRSCELAVGERTSVYLGADLQGQVYVRPGAERARAIAGTAA